MVIQPTKTALIWDFTNKNVELWDLSNKKIGGWTTKTRDLSNKNANVHRQT